MTFPEDPHGPVPVTDSAQSPRREKIPKINDQRQNHISNHIQSLNVRKCGAEGKRISQIAQTARTPHKRGWQGGKIWRADTCANTAHESTRPRRAHKHVHNETTSARYPFQLPSWSFTLLACQSQGINTPTWLGARSLEKLALTNRQFLLQTQLLESAHTTCLPLRWTQKAHQDFPRRNNPIPSTKSLLPWARARAKFRIGQICQWGAQRTGQLRHTSNEELARTKTSKT